MSQRNLLLWLLSLFGYYCYAQLQPSIHFDTPVVLPQKAISSEKTCGTHSMTVQQRRYTLDVIDQAGTTRNAGTTPLPVRIHIVRQDGGTGGISLDDVNIGFSFLNYYYLDAGIEYFITAVNYINSTTWYDFDDTEEAALTAAHTVDDAINIYFFNSITIGSDPVCGYAYYPANADYSINVFMDNSCTVTHANGTLVHELGHFFNLQHTHDGTGNGNTDPDAENVPRTGGNANCNTHGDMLCDTEADPNGSNDAGCNFINDGNSTQDTYGNTYAPDLGNIMSYYSDYCGGDFSSGQYTRMANALTTRQGHTAYDLDGATPATVVNPSGLTASMNNHTTYAVDLSWTDNANNETGYLIERSSDGGTTWRAVSGGGVGPNVTSFSDNTISGNTTYHYRVKASNDDANHYSGTTSVVVGAIYGLPTHQSNSCTVGGALGVAIYNFLLEETSGTDLIDNDANGCNGPLTIFSDTHTANLTAGTTYDFEANLQLGTPPSGSWYDQHITIWVDNNQDNDFADAGEMLYQSSAGGGPTLNGSITIPATALNGNTTLRIRSGWDAGGPVADPNDYHAFSEAEDYGLFISGGLPVELISFTGIQKKQTVELNWSTASEENNDFFIVERSTNGTSFDYIGQLPGKGTSETVNVYRLEDTEPKQGTNYYRLIQIDLDGTRHIQDHTVVVEFTPDGVISIHPNPVSLDQLNLHYRAPKRGDNTIRIYDVAGWLRMEKTVMVERGDNQVILDLPALNPGIFLVKVDRGDGQQTAVRFMKSR